MRRTTKEQMISASPKNRVGGLLMAALLFLVQWQENQLHLNLRSDSDGFSHTGENDFYTVEAVDHSIMLKTKKDVDLFLGNSVLKSPFEIPVGMSNPPSYTQDQYERKGGIISDKAFNVKVKEIQE